MATKLRVVRLDDLTVSDIVQILNLNFCGAIQQYIKFGNDLRAAWAAAFDDDSHYEALQKALGAEKAGNFPEGVIDAVLKFMDPDEVTDYTREEIRTGLTNSFDDSIWKEKQLPKDWEEKEYRVIRGIIHEKVKKRLEENQPLFGMTLLDDKPVDSKKSKKARKKK